MRSAPLTESWKLLDVSETQCLCSRRQIYVYHTIQEISGFIAAVAAFTDGDAQKQIVKKSTNLIKLR